jgi:hypothetical protein
MMPNPPLQPTPSPVALPKSTLALPLEKPWFYIALAALLLAIDYWSGPFLQFPISFVIPVALSAWYCSGRLALALAIFQPVFRFLLSFQWQHTPNFYWNVELQAANALIRVVVLCVIAYFISRSVQQHRELGKRIRLLSGHLPICFQCKKIQDEKQLWQEIDLYLSRHSDLQFSQALCPDCKNHDYGDIVGR